MGVGATSQAACSATETPAVLNGRVVHWYEGR
ncbi:hypothetical protein BJ997_003711 [Cryobacterium roopkundense]|uniref:Uncharacterized protein n=1 Tax=Cryobacterium roopkundense TaxID=1001240 RepID=A0A7W9E5D6_9MICO|nr:hypothetical protein [Cryobacterium roopkundense]